MRPPVAALLRFIPHPFADAATFSRFLLLMRLPVAAILLSIPLPFADAIAFSNLVDAAALCSPLPFIVIAFEDSADFARLSCSFLTLC